MAIAEKSITDASQQVRKFYERAQAAVKNKNYVYACEMFRAVLHADPGIVEARDNLREAQLENIGRKVSVLRQTMVLFKVAIPIFMKGPNLRRTGKLGDALDLAERAMDADPTFLPTLQFLAETATKAELHKAAVRAWEVAAEYHPKDVKVLISLANYYKQLEQYQKCLRIWSQITALQPNNMQFGNELRSVSALAAMDQGKWHDDGDYHGKMKDPNQSGSLSRTEDRVIRGEEQLKATIIDAEKEVAKQPSTANHKRLADLYRQAREWDKAVVQYELVIKTMGALDPVIDTALTEVYAQRFDDAIAQWKSYGEQDPAQAAEAEKQITALEAERTAMIFQRMLDRVKRYPNDASYRYELGQMYFDRGELDAALPELQYAQKNPQYRRKCLALMGRCMMEKEMMEMAIDHFASALDGLERQDGDRKDFLYYQALAYEKHGELDKCMANLKEVYSIDVGFRDVAQRLQAVYQKKQA